MKCRKFLCKGEPGILSLCVRDLCLLEAHPPEVGLMRPCQFPRTERKEKSSHQDTHFCLLLTPFSPLNLFCAFKDPEEIGTKLLILSIFHKSQKTQERFDMSLGMVNLEVGKVT